MPDLTKEDIAKLERAFRKEGTMENLLYAEADLLAKLPSLVSLARAQIEGREAGGELAQHLPANAGICAADWDECTVTVAFDTEEDTRAVYAALPERNRVRLCRDKHEAADALAAKEKELERMREALGDLLHAVCGETGFAECVRRDSGKAYPWPALDEAEKSARAALDGSDAEHHLSKEQEIERLRREASIACESYFGHNGIDLLTAMNRLRAALRKD